MKFFIYFCISTISTCLISAELSLDKLKELALSHNDNLKSLSYSINASDGEIEVSKSRFYPKVGVQLGKEWSHGDSRSESDNLISIYGKINLFNGFKDVHNLKKGQLLKSNQMRGLNNQKLFLSLSIEKFYYTYLYLVKKSEVIEKSINRNNRHLKLVKQRLSSNLITKTDLLEFKLRQSDLKSEKEFVKLELLRVKKQLLNFSGILDIDGNELIGNLPHLYIKSDLKKLIEKSLNQNSEIQSLQSSVKDSRISEEISKSNWYPSVDLQGRYGRLDENETGFSNDKNSSVVSLTATWEIFSGFSKRGNAKKTFNKRKAAEYKVKQKGTDLALEIESTLNYLNILEKRINSVEKNQKTAVSLYSKTLSEYKKGVKDSGALISASDLFKSLSDQIFEMKLKYVNSKIKLEKIVGQQLNFQEIKH